MQSSPPHRRRVQIRYAASLLALVVLGSWWPADVARASLTEREPGVSGMCPRAEPRGISFGSSISTNGQTAAEALATVDRLFGRVPIVRVFDQAMAWPWDKPRAKMLAGRDLVVSFRPMPQDVLSGRYDAEFRLWFERAPENVAIFWSYIHEPEQLIDDGAFTADEYRLAWRHINMLADAVCRTNMYPTLILTGWTATAASNRDWRAYYPGSDVIDVMAFDPYNGVHDPGRDYYASPESMFDPVVEVAREAGKPYAIAETGSRKVPSDLTGSMRAAWLADLADYHRQNGAVFVTYFHSARDGEWRLLDEPSASTWGAVVQDSPADETRPSLGGLEKVSGCLPAFLRAEDRPSNHADRACGANP